MENLKDLSTSFKAALYERSKSPFYLAFVLSWLGWNWKFITYLFFDNPNSTETIAEKLDFISNNYIDIHTNLWNPLWTSLVVFIVGNLLTLIFLAGKNGSIWIKRKYIEGIEPFDKEREKLVREQLLKEEKRINDMVLSVNKELEIYKKKNFDLTTDMQKLQKKNIELNNQKINSDNLNNEIDNLKAEIERKEQQHELNVNAIGELKNNINNYRKKENDTAIENKRLTTAYNQVITEKDNYQGQLDGKEKEIKELKNEKANLEKLLDDYRRREDQASKRKEKVILEKINKMGYMESFENTLSYIGKKQFISFSDSIDYFIKLNLIKIDESEMYSSKNAMFKLTDLGEAVKNYHSINY